MEDTLTSQRSTQECRTHVRCFETPSPFFSEQLYSHFIGCIYWGPHRGVHLNDMPCGQGQNFTDSHAGLHPGSATEQLCKLLKFFSYKVVMTTPLLGLLMG